VKIYTKTGDGGDTGLFGGGRVPKDHHRVEAYGAVDEANSILGIVVALITDPVVGDAVVRVQGWLFELGALLATPTDASPTRLVREMDPAHIEYLERWMDDAERELPELRNFILPGGCPAGASLHHARTVVRRAERRTVSLVRDGVVHASAVTFLNRLSDFLFVAARLVNHRTGEPETTWRFPLGGSDGE
jgi:cob(I)alamin adenosyltransferase